MGPHVQSFGVALDANLQWRIDKDLHVGANSASNFIPHVAVGGNHGDQSNRSLVGQIARGIADAEYILIAVLLGESQFRAESTTQLIRVQYPDFELAHAEQIGHGSR